MSVQNEHDKENPLNGVQDATDDRGLSKLDNWTVGSGTVLCALEPWNHGTRNVCP